MLFEQVKQVATTKADLRTVLCKLKVLELFVHVYATALSRHAFTRFQSCAPFRTARSYELEYEICPECKLFYSGQIKSLHMSISAYGCSLIEVG